MFLINRLEIINAINMVKFILVFAMTSTQIRAILTVLRLYDQLIG